MYLIKLQLHFKRVFDFLSKLGESSVRLTTMVGCLVILVAMSALFVQVTSFIVYPSTFSRSGRGLRSRSLVKSQQLFGIFGNSEADERVISNLMDQQSLSRDEAEKEYNKFKVRPSQLSFPLLAPFVAHFVLLID